MTPYLEIGGDYREVLPGVWLIELPLPFSLGLINVYLVRLAEGYLLVDCGMETEACFEALARSLEGLGIPWTAIRHVLLTHIHPDHIGLAPRVLSLSRAPLHLHPADETLLAEITAAENYRAWQRDVLRRAGVEAMMIELIAGSLLDIQNSFHRLAADRPIQDGAHLPTAHGALELVWTPGHSPGHVCLYDRARRVLLSGDHILEHISPNIGWQPGRDALGEYLDSLDKVAALEVDLILPSHGAPFSGHRKWVRKTQLHHRERCAQILAAASAQPVTAAALVSRLWERSLSPFHYRFAVFEVLAHLEYLERRGHLTRCPDHDLWLWHTL